MTLVNILTDVMPGGNFTMPNLAKLSLPGASDSLIYQWLRKAARDFCDKTEVWKETQTALTTTAGTADYTLVVPDDYIATIKRIYRLLLNGVDQTEADFSFAPDLTLTFTTAPSQSSLSILPSVIYLPKATCEEYPDWIIDRFGMAITFGAIAMLKSQGNKDWSDPKGSGVFEREWADGIAAAKAENLHGRKLGPVTTLMRSFV